MHNNASRLSTEVEKMQLSAAICIHWSWVSYYHVATLWNCLQNFSKCVDKCFSYTAITPAEEAAIEQNTQTTSNDQTSVMDTENNNWLSFLTPDQTNRTLYKSCKKNLSVMIQLVIITLKQNLKQTIIAVANYQY